MNISFRQALPEDRPALQALLVSLHLPIEDLPNDLSGFTLAFDEDKLVGSAGLQPFGSIGLLRSVAVHPAYRSAGLGQQLYSAALDYALRQQVKEVWLITTTADRYFEKKGFQRISRDQTPMEISTTEQFTALCAASAVVMRKQI